MGFIPHFLAGGLFNRYEMNKKLDEISAITEPAWKLIDTLDGTTGFSGEWVAPDVFGDGSAYDLGVYMIGGGESGEAYAYLYKDLNTGNERSGYARGGSSGNAVNHIFPGVAPGSVYAWVVGKGGIAVTVTNDYHSDKNAGGTTSFWGVTAAGGEGINSSCPSRNAISGTIHRYFAGMSATYSQYSDYGRDSVTLERLILNQFDQTMISLAHGMGASVDLFVDEELPNVSVYSHKETPGIPNPTIGVLGTAAVAASKSGESLTVKAVSGTYGNGGGGACALSGTTRPSSSATVTATSGAGGDGVIFLYARKAVTE